MITTKTWRSDYQRFRFLPNGQQYVITRTKRGRIAVYVFAGYKRTASSCQLELWRKLPSAVEQRAAIATIARLYGDDPAFRRIWVNPAPPAPSKKGKHR